MPVKNVSSANQLVCTVDESGPDQGNLRRAERGQHFPCRKAICASCAQSISGFCANFTPHEFNSVYNFKYELEGTVLKLANINVLENLEVINNAASTQPVNLCYAPESGIITYSIDGYEDKAPSDLTDADFQKDNYEKTQLISNELTSASDPPLPTFHQRKLENRNSGRPHDSSAVRERAVRQSAFPQKPV